MRTCQQRRNTKRSVAADVRDASRSTRQGVSNARRRTVCGGKQQSYVANRQQPCLRENLSHIQQPPRLAPATSRKQLKLRQWPTVSNALYMCTRISFKFAASVVERPQSRKDLKHFQEYPTPNYPHIANFLTIPVPFHLTSLQQISTNLVFHFIVARDTTPIDYTLRTPPRPHQTTNLSRSRTVRCSRQRRFGSGGYAAFLAASAAAAFRFLKAERRLPTMFMYMYGAPGT